MCPSWILGNDYLYHSLRSALFIQCYHTFNTSQPTSSPAAPTPDLVARFQTKFSLSTSCSVSVYLYAVLRDTVFKKWIDLWVYIMGFIFFLICCVCISHSSLFNQKEWAIDCVYCGSKKRSCFKIALFANIDWPWNPSEISNSLSCKYLMSHIFVQVNLWAKSQGFISATVGPAEGHFWNTFGTPICIQVY